MASISNDVPEFLNELIPYRCPKCGHLRRFATLRELRQHLQSEHSFQMGFVKPHARAHVFKGTRDGSNSSSFSRSLSSEDMFNGTSGKHGRDQVNELRRNNNEYDASKKFTRDTSPLLKSFKEETELLEKELQQARQNEMKHKTLSMHNLTECSVNTDFKKSLEAIQKPTEPKPKPRNTTGEFTSINPTHFHTNFVNKTESYEPFPHAQIGSNYDFKSTLDTLNSEVMKSRMNQWVTTDALYKSQDLLREMETAAEMKCQEQKGIIEQLIQDMKTKDAMLESRTKQQSELSTERQRLLDETESIVKQTDAYNTRLRHELDGRGKILEGLNKELEKLKTQSEQEIKSKECDLQNAAQKISQLEWERERLIQETDSILKRADRDTGKLRETLQMKEEELKNVNKVLNQLRQQQQTMLERTMTVYRSSEESREIMKTAIQTKDGQLQHAMKQIENMTSLHKRLLEQSQILTDQADDNTSSMKRLLHAKGEQIHDLVQQLDTLKREKRHLEENTVSLAEQAESSVSVVQNLRDMVKQKENDLKTTQSELQNLKSFLMTTADKEKVARQKLEVFIEDLIKRAEQAESELHVLKSQSTQSASTLHDVKMESFSDIHNSESTTRKSLPSKLNMEPSEYHAANLDQTQPSKSHLGQTDSISDSFKAMPLKSMFVTAADVHQFHPGNMGDIITPVSADGNISPRNNTSNLLNLTGKRLEESGGFVVQEENCHSPDNTYLHGQQHLTESGKSTSYLEQSGSNKPHRRKKSKGSRKRFERSYESSSNEAIDKCKEFQKRRKDSNAKDVKDTPHQHTKVSRRAKVDTEEELENSTDELDSEGQSDTEYYKLQDAELMRLKTSCKVSRGLQVGAFLSNQNLDNEAEKDLDEFNTFSDEDDSYDDIEYRNRPRSITPNSTYGLEKHIGEEAERPVTMGKSPKNKNTAKEIRHKENKKKTRHYLNRKFDTNPPTVHRSMVNITKDGIDLSEGEVLLRNEDRHRRSRSLSPRTIAARTAYQTRDIEQFPGTSEYEDDISDDDDVIMHGNDVVENTDGVFSNIMDDNGILWDDDNATLPDVSDSELDRVSPSGSEALTSKNMCNATTAIYSNLNVSPKTSKHHDRIVKSHPKYAHNDTEESSISNVAKLLNSPGKKSGRRMISPSRKTETMEIKTYSWSPKAIKEDELNDTENSRENQKSTKVTFRPIKSPLFSKSSTSERDLSSGGREVKNIMNASPKINVMGAPGTASLGSLSSNSRIHSRSSGNLSSRLSGNSSYIRFRDSTVKSPEKISRTPTQASTSHRIRHTTTGQYKAKAATEAGKMHAKVPSDKRSDTFTNEYNTRMPTESIDERIERISSKYSPKHSSKPVKTGENTPLNIDERIKAINSKYKTRRNDIIQGKGVGSNHEFPTYVDRTFDSKRSPSTVGDKTLHKHNGSLFSTTPGFYLSKDETPINQDTSQLRLSSNASMPKEQSLTNVGYPQQAYQPWTSVNGNSNGQPYFPYPFPYPPNWNQYPPFYPGNMETILQQHLQQQQQMQNVESQKRNQSMNKHQKEQHQSKDKITQNRNQIEEQDQQQIQRLEKQNEHQLQKEQHGIQKQNMYEDQKVDKTERERERYRSNAASPHADQMFELKSDAENTHIAKESEMKEYERGHSSELKKKCPSGLDIDTVPKQEGTSTDTHDQERAAENDIVFPTATFGTREMEPPYETIASERTGTANLLGKHSTEITPIPEISTHKEAYLNTNDHDHEALTSDSNLSPESRNDTNEDIEEIIGMKLKSTASISNRCTLDDNIDSRIKPNPHLSLFDDTDNDESSLSIMNKTSIFAEEIGEESSAEYDSNTQSYLDLPDRVTDTDIEGDTDTESVRRDFYENTNRIKELLDGPQNDFSDVYRHKLTRNTTSSASSQASLEILDRIPTAKREQVKQRRAALVCIFSFLDTRTLSRVARVCREWRIVSRSPKLWRRVEIRGEKISSQFLRQISRRCSQLRVLILEDLHPRNRNHEESVEDYQKNIRCSLEIGYEQILKKAEATLHTIVIVNCGTLFSAKCLWIASCCCRMLKHVTYISDFDPINAEVMWALGSGCRELVTLKCQPIFPCVHADNFTTKCAQLVGKCFRDLEIVSIGGLIVEVNAMIFIAKQCQKLREIEVHQMKFISCDTIDEMCQNGIQSLRSIQFHATPVAPGALAVLQGNCKHLDVIYIQLTESDFTASVTDQSVTSQIPEYHEIVDGYEALKNQPSLCNILALKVERPKTPQPVKEPLPERSFFDRLFGKNE